MLLRWWRRRKDRKIVAWLRTVEGQQYLADHPNLSIVLPAGALEVSAMDVVGEALQE